MLLLLEGKVSSNRVLKKGDSKMFYASELLCS
jgi:hypothetical protein